jgi:polysaccharide export outer membrane protein
MHAALEQPYLLDAGDRIRVTVFGQDGLNNTYNVDQAGYISFPLVGSIPARGHTVKQMEAAIAAKLRQGYIRDPDVTVEVDRYRPVFVMGEVGAAGQYSYVPGMTAQKAIAAAGGFSPRAYQGDVDVTRTVNGKVMTGRVVISDPLLPGDTVYVRERLF